MLGDADLGLVVVGNASLEGLESGVDDGVAGVLLTGEDPDELVLGNIEISARVNDGEVLVVGVNDAVVTGGGVGEELDETVGTIEGSNSLSFIDDVGDGVVLGVENSNGAVLVEAVAGLLAIVGFPRHGGVTSLLPPEAHILGGIEGVLEGGGGAGTGADASVDEANECEGGEDDGLHVLEDFLIFIIITFYQTHSFYTHKYGN